MINHQKIKQAFGKVKEEIEDTKCDIKETKKSNEIILKKLIELENKINELSEFSSEKVSLEIASIRLEFEQKLAGILFRLDSEDLKK